MESFKVTVAGQTFLIRSDAEEAHVHKLASELTEKFSKFEKKGPRATQEFRAMTMVAMMLLDELHETKKQRDTLKSKAKAFAENLIMQIDRILERKV